ncbi:hypothetical protein [Micromonospora sp. WMMD980]|uniref:hypothetical protein n=1 Tax=Micromonospora sp. WMMD980 TaxID=3016088 RepID=UPI002416C7F4|nr:hypothetical protein [Micromonospora sp. WMMD980]MDG4803078.1 hypothetical protein [Micromonospora sp. WMMD980]
MSLSGPVVGSAAPGRDGLWSRRLLSLLAGTAVAVVVGRGLLALGPASVHRFRDLAWVVTGLHLAQRYWRPRRTGRLVRAARPNPDRREGGVMLRLDPVEIPGPVVGGRDVAVSDERLLAAIERFRVAPETLAVGLPVTPPEATSQRG